VCVVPTLMLLSELSVFAQYHLLSAAVVVCSMCVMTW